MSGRDKQDVDTNVGRGDPGGGADIGPTSGTAAAPSTDAALGLGGTSEGAGLTGYAGDGAQTSREEREDPASDADFGSGLETGNASRGSATNAAQRVDTFNTPESHRS
jgi:hypothetical protein